MEKRCWIVTVGGGYGSFLFHGTSEEAEEMRCHKARWEGAPAHFRRATPDEILKDAVDHTLPTREFPQPGDVWQSPRGALHRVAERNEGTNQVVLRKGEDGKGRKQFRSMDNVNGWKLIAPTN